DNANDILLESIRLAMAQPADGASHPVVAEMRRAVGDDAASNKYVAAIQRNTISLTNLAAGVGSPLTPHVIPSTAEATLDCRVLPGMDINQFIVDLKARINDPRVTVEVLNMGL